MSENKLLTKRKARPDHSIKTKWGVTLVKHGEPRVSFNDLPPELLLEIFSWLPLTTVVRVRHTCKLWYKLMADPRMLAAQLCGRRQNAVGHLACVTGPRHGLCYAEKVGSNLCFLGPVLQQREHEVRPYPLASGGFVFYETAELPRFYYVENPITGEHIQIPHDNLAYGSYGFGHALSTGEYKLVKIGPMLPSSVWVFTVGSGHWRRLQTIPFVIDDNNLSFECEGVIFWKIYQDEVGIDMNRLVMSFDVASERVRTWKGPEVEKQVCRDDIHVAKFGNFAACVYGKWTNELQIWILRDMAKDIWVKEHNIFCGISPPLVFDRLVCSGSWIGNDVFFGRISEYVFSRRYYSIKDDGNGDFKAVACPIAETIVGAVTHIGTLVSPLKLFGPGDQ